MLIILDRDGVINFESPDYIKSPEEWHPIPGSIEAIAKLSRAGYIVVLATNQSGLARGLYDRAMLDCIHQKMIDLVEQHGGKITKIYFCPHHPDDHCDCRKPKPGMLLQIIKDFSTTVDQLFFIGDSVRDYDAAAAVGCRFILVMTGNGSDAIKKINDASVSVFPDLLSAAYFLA
jgi:D-glycero-D-manno-heptose 1,7-bisphosphate phosphatase